MIEIKLSQLEERILELRAAVKKRVALVAEMEVVVFFHSGDKCHVCINVKMLITKST